MTFEEAWNALHAELEHWPSWHLTEIHASSSSGTHHNGEWGEGKWFYQTLTGWCAVAIEDGWAEGAPSSTYRPHFLNWADSPAAAMDGLRGIFQERREQPHLGRKPGAADA